ncbi:hypothetical protein [Thomasclavelia spiroformis]|nr:hypothetical protein [Thomasclavelia spiroformis]
MTYIMIFIANFFDVVATFPSIFITILALYIYDASIYLGPVK